ncbi:MAG: D-cysteine desulfhydrase family protein [Acidobacteriota bacterium]
MKITRRSFFKLVAGGITATYSSPLMINNNISFFFPPKSSSIKKFENIPHLKFGFYPTPIEELKNLREELKSPVKLFIKRDDYTGMTISGNKVRKLEYLMYDVLKKKADTVITIGPLQSNHARATAMFCAKLGLKCILVLNGKPQEKPTANALLNNMLGAEIHYVDTRPERPVKMKEIAEELQSRGKNVYQIPLGGSIPVGSLGYVKAMGELAHQLRKMDLKIDYIFFSSSSGGTHAGMEVGKCLYKLNNIKLIGVSPDDPADEIKRYIIDVANPLFEELNMKQKISSEDITILEEYIGEGYEIPTPESNEALSLLAKKEGIFLDPVYTSKAMAAVIDLIRKGKFKSNENILFWHTGGTIALFA